MANDGTGTNWDENDPLGNLPARDGQVQLRDLRKAVRQRSEKEHTTFAAAGAGGEHKPGSAVMYVGGTAPTKRPDGATNLGAGDVGRMWLDTSNGTLKYVNGAGAFTAVMAADILNATITSNKIVDGAVITAKIADANVTTAKIADGAVTSAKIALGNIGSNQIADGSVTAGKIADANVTLPKLDLTLTTLMGVRIKKSNYTGNGTTTKAVTGLGFQPDILFIMDLATGQLSMVSQTWGTVIVVVNNTILAAGTVSLDADGFTVKTSNANVNTNGRIYGWIALRVNS